MLAWLILAAATATAAPDDRGLKVLSNDETLSFAWTLSSESGWLAPYDGQDPRWKRYADGVRRSLDARPRALLERQRALFVEEGRSTDPVDWALARPAQIRPISRLEATLFLTHWRDAEPRHREFQAFVLRRGDLLRVYYTRSDERRAWPKSGALKRLVKADLDDGWELFAHLHNHPFFADNAYGDVAGTVAPSEGDAALFGELAAFGRLQRAWITNGLDTLEIPADQFPKLPAD